MMEVYAAQAGLKKRRLIPVPVLTPRLSSLSVGLVTPVPAQLARPLVDSLVNPVVVNDHRAELVFPFDRVPLAEAIHRAIGRTAVGDVPTRFDDASSPVWQALATDPEWTGGTELTDVRAVIVPADPHATWGAVCRIGGDKGWYTGEILWKLRGLLDQLAGGPGLRRGRRHPDRLTLGAPVDFWRVEDIEDDRLLVLHARCVSPERRGSPGPWSRSTTAPCWCRRPVIDLVGFWDAVLVCGAPFDRRVFPGLLNGIARDAADGAGGRGSHLLRRWTAHTVRCGACTFSSCPAGRRSVPSPRPNLFLGTTGIIKTKAC